MDALGFANSMVEKVEGSGMGLRLAIEDPSVASWLYTDVRMYVDDDLGMLVMYVREGSAVNREEVAS